MIHLKKFNNPSLNEGLFSHGFTRMINLMQTLFEKKKSIKTFQKWVNTSCKITLVSTSKFHCFRLSIVLNGLVILLSI
jgi:hypothetical protein